MFALRENDEWPPIGGCTNGGPGGEISGSAALQSALDWLRADEVRSASLVEVATSHHA